MTARRSAQESSRHGMTLPMPYVDVDALVAMQRQNFDALVAANKIYIETAQGIASCQSEMMRDCVEELTRAFTALTSGQQGRKGGGETAVQALFEKTAGHVRQIAELIGKSNAETIELMNGRVRALMEEARSASERRLATETAAAD